MGCVGSIAAAGIRAAHEQQKKSEAEKRAKEMEEVKKVQKEEDRKLGSDQYAEEEQREEERRIATQESKKVAMAERKEAPPKQVAGIPGGRPTKHHPPAHLLASLRIENADGSYYHPPPKGPMSNLLKVLHSAISIHHDSDVQEAIKQVEDSDLSDKSCVVNRSIGTQDGMTCLQYAIATRCDRNIIELLMTLGGDSNRLDNYGRNALHHLAIASGRMGEETFHTIHLIEKVVVESANEYGGNQEAVAFAVGLMNLKKKKETPVDWNAQDAFMCTPLHYAAESDNAHVLHYLTDNCGANLNVLDNRLRFAHEIAKTPRAKKKILNEMKRENSNKLHHEKKLLSQLKFHLATLFDKDNPATTDTRCLDGLDAYRTTGKRSIDEVTPNGHTALHFAAARNSVPCAQYFIKHNANPHIRDNYGQLPIDLAASPEMKALIQEAMNNTPDKP